MPRTESALLSALPPQLCKDRGPVNSQVVLLLPQFVVSSYTEKKPTTHVSYRIGSQIICIKNPLAQASHYNIFSGFAI